VRPPLIIRSSRHCKVAGPSNGATGANRRGSPPFPLRFSAALPSRLSVTHTWRAAATLPRGPIHRPAWFGKRKRTARPPPRRVKRGTAHFEVSVLVFQSSLVQSAGKTGCHVAMGLDRGRLSEARDGWNHAFHTNASAFNPGPGLKRPSCAAWRQSKSVGPAHRRGWPPLGQAPILETAWLWTRTDAGCRHAQPSARNGTFPIYFFFVILPQGGPRSGPRSPLGQHYLAPFDGARHDLRLGLHTKAGGGRPPLEACAVSRIVTRRVPPPGPVASRALSPPGRPTCCRKSLDRPAPTGDEPGGPCPRKWTTRPAALVVRGLRIPSVVQATNPPPSFERWNSKGRTVFFFLATGIK